MCRDLWTAKETRNSRPHCSYFPRGLRLHLCWHYVLGAQSKASAPVSKPNSSLSLLRESLFILEKLRSATDLMDFSQALSRSGGLDHIRLDALLNGYLVPSRCTRDPQKAVSCEKDPVKGFLSEARVGKRKNRKNRKLRVIPHLQSVVTARVRPLCGPRNKKKKHR